jgi:hypothetical protein
MRTALKTQKKASFVGIALTMAVFLIVACSKDVPDALPANGDVAYVNFVNVGEAFLYGTQEDMLQRENRIYFNDSINNAPFDKYNHQGQYPAEFSAESGLDIRQYPQHFTGNNIIIDNNAQGDVYWLPLHSGDYRFIFTSRDRTYLHTTSTALDRQTFYQLYLVESPESEESYTVVEAPLQRPERVDGQITVQFVHLSPDAGDVEVYRVDSEGNELATATDAPFSFGENAMVSLSMEGIEATFNRILLRFRSPGGADLHALSVPAQSGAVYTVLLRGFAQQTERKVKIDNQNSVSVTVLPNLRSSIRRVFY